jgi:hypothetical protein
MSEVLEVTWSWKNELLSVEHARNVEQLFLRPHRHPLPGPGLLLRPSSAVLPVPPGSPVTMHGCAHVMEETTPLTVKRGETARIQWHGLEANIRWVEEQAIAPTRGSGIDTLWMQVSTGVGGLVALMAGLMMTAPSENADVQLERNLRAATRMVALTPPRPPKKPPAPHGGARPRTMGRVGLQHANVTHAARPRGNSVDVASRAELQRQARGVGVMAMLSARGGALAQVLSADLGGEIANTLGTLSNGPLDAAAGTGGWASRGSGNGGGNTVEGLGTLGSGKERGPPGAGDGPLARRQTIAPEARCADCTVVGGLTKEEIARVLRRHFSQIRYCYEKQLNSQPNLAGKVVASFVIGGSGRVDSADVAESSLDHEPTETCITNVLRRLVFPAPRGGGTVLVNHPFLFQTAGQ